MNILNSLTLKNLKLNKKRTIVTIIGITLSVALICAITTFVSSFQESLKDLTISRTGNYHMKVKNIPIDSAKYVLNNVKIKDYYITKQLGYAKLEGIQNKNKPYVYMEEFDDKALNNMAIKLVEGRMPQDSSEIVIPEHLFTNGKLALKTGDRLNLAIGDRTIEGELLNQNNPYLSGEEEELGKEIFETKFDKTYTIVGIMERPDFEDYSAPGYTLISKSKSEVIDTDKNQIYAIFHKPGDVYEYGEQIKFDEKFSELENFTVSYNDELLRFEGVAKQASSMTTIIMMASIVICIIIFTSVFVIKNSFNISITERVKQYGMLSSIGATSKQIKNNVLYEGFILGLIAIPLGIIVGIGAIAIVIMVISGLLETSNIVSGMMLKLSISWLSILISVIVSIITIFISSILPARKASKITPIDAIRENNDVKIQNKKLRTSKIITKIFGVEGEIASKNLKRNKRKYRTTVFSIVISIVLFMSMNSIIEYGFKVQEMLYEDAGYNITIPFVSSSYSSINEEMDSVNKILQLDNIKDYSIKKVRRLKLSSNEFLADELKNNVNLSYENQTDISMVALGDSYYREYIKSLGFTYEEVKDKGILLDKIITYVTDKNNNTKRLETNILKIKDNEFLNYIDIKNKAEENIQIKQRTDKFPMGISQNSYQAYVIVSDEYMSQFDNYSINNMYIYSSNASKLQEDIEKTQPGLKDFIYNSENAQQEQKALVIIISIFLYGFITVISVIGITNIFNTITTNMALRNKEFAILKSIGMTQKEFKKMINYESLLYGLKSLLIGLVLGTLASFGLYNIFKSSYEYQYRLPFDAMGICVIFVFLIIFIIMRYSVNKTKKQNIMDEIRKDTI